MNKEVIRKMKLARKYQKEAFLELLPENIRGSAEVIEREMKNILWSTMLNAGQDIMQMFVEEETAAEKKEKEPKGKTVRKVDIG